ncbi:nucleotidyltransferase family protein [Sphingomonas montana]|uniref:nucleotidyltransferase family protein n=1 Tax=Sphingomonas montana TaxID=1843236 RepID=UPI00096D1FE2|nr:NTP transferase domain-containing protein [Sphingomonas montana]
MRVAILLAAGRSRRFGRANKLLVQSGGLRLIDRTLAIARAAPVARVVVVTGHDAPAVTRAARGVRTTIVHARDHEAGMGASLAAGLAVLRPREREVIVLLADMPGVPGGLAARLWRALRPGDAGVRPVWRGLPGHPVLLRLPLVQMPTGDAGPGRGARLRPVPGPRGCVQDVDTRGMLARAVTKRRPAR